jgi:hypothetical protein
MKEITSLNQEAFLGKPFHASISRNMKSSRFHFFKPAIALLFIFGETFGTTLSVQSQNIHEANQKACALNLGIIHHALQLYRANHKDFPKLLSDLPINRELFCPEANRLGQTSAGKVGRPAFEDPRSTYFYEFAPVQLSTSLPGEPVLTNRDFKRRQMGLVGSDVPIVRCFLHGNDHALNLTFGGNVYESRLGWEAKFDELVKREDLTTGLFKAEHRVVLIAFRDSGAPAETIDLTRHYNASLATPWLLKDPRAVLNPARVGLNRWEEVWFDVRGIVQLSSTKSSALYPPEIRGIQVGQRCARLHFLQGKEKKTVRHVSLRQSWRAS